MDSVEAKRSGRAGVPKRILVVDDEPTIRELISATLAEAGFRTETACNGLDALHRMRRQAPDAVVLDLMMPVMDATGLLDLMRLRPRLQQVPILVMSAAYGAQEEARRLGARACLTKPFQLDELIATVAELVGSPLPPMPELFDPRINGQAQSTF